MGKNFNEGILQDVLCAHLVFHVTQTHDVKLGGINVKQRFLSLRTSSNTILYEFLFLHDSLALTYFDLKKLHAQSKIVYFF